MKIKPENMKTCFNCRFAVSFLIPEYDRDGTCAMDVECSSQSNQWISIKIKESCPHWKGKW